MLRTNDSGKAWLWSNGDYVCKFRAVNHGDDNWTYYPTLSFRVIDNKLVRVTDTPKQYDDEFDHECLETVDLPKLERVYS